MSYNQKNYLEKIKYLQEQANVLYDKHVFINLKQIWRILTAEKKVFCSYRSFLKYMSESQVNERLQNEIRKQQPNLVDDSRQEKSSI